MASRRAAILREFPTMIDDHALIDTWRTRAEAFAKEFRSASYEMGEAQEFIRGICEIFDLKPRRAVCFEERVKQLKSTRRIDGLFPGALLIEMKSAGEDLDLAYAQACGYLPLLADADRPRYVLVSDFQRLRLYDHSDTAVAPLAFDLTDMRTHILALSFLAGYERRAAEIEEEANIRAAEKLGALHDALIVLDYTGKDLEALLIRLLFCFFADDTGLFSPPGQFTKLLLESSDEDGHDLSGILDMLFITLDTEKTQRIRATYPPFHGFPYVNGELFQGRLPPCYFDAAARRALIECAEIDWKAISPDIFGALFQYIMHHADETAGKKDGKRREFGAHYTSERNILKVIAPLFLDDLRAEFKAARSKNDLQALLLKLRDLQFFDPACGCGNFLVVAYRELRLLEWDAKKKLARMDKSGTVSSPDVDVDQFHGIEIDPAAVAIATVALWLTDHQMNRRYGSSFQRLPLKKKPNIVCDNALRIDWADVVAPSKCSFVMGNPPFIGHQWRSTEQMNDMERVWGTDGRFGRLDYVTCWYHNATEFMRKNPSLRSAFVSTNSITQGEQVGTLWSWLMAKEQGIRIHFAHRTFRWSNEARGKAAVHCVIIGFGIGEPSRQRRLFEYENINGEPIAIRAKNINAYLVDAPDVLLPSRTDTPKGLPQLIKGSQPTDGGHLILTESEKDRLLIDEPGAKKWLRYYVGGDELINGGWRWCLWLKGITAEELAALPKIAERVRKVAEERRKSPTKSVKEFADKPMLFTQDRQPDGDYLGVPEVSSENRDFIPIAFFKPSIVASNKVQVVQGATIFHFGMLCSAMHNAWMRAVCGRMKSDYSYAPAVYNNFPWPTPTDAQRAAIEAAAQGVLDARAAHPDKNLAWLYNPETMPVNLKQAHADVDKAVDAAYRYKGKPTDAERVAFLFKRYAELVAPKKSRPKAAQSQPLGIL